MSLTKLISYICILVLGAAALVLSVIELVRGDSTVIPSIIKIVLAVFFVGYGTFGVVKYAKEKNK